MSARSPIAVGLPIAIPRHVESVSGLLTFNLFVISLSRSLKFFVLLVFVGFGALAAVLVLSTAARDSVRPYVQEARAILDEAKTLISQKDDAEKKKDQLPLRTAAEILQTVQLPEGYEATVFALPPNGAYPTSVSAAPDGTIFVAMDTNGSLERTRNTGLRRHLSGKPGKPGKVVRMRDTDGDGRADEFKTFAEMESPRGVIWDGPRGAGPGTLYVVYPPKLTAFHDTDGDGVADKEEDLLTGLGFDLSFRGADHTTNGGRLAIDGFIYIAVGDYGFTKAVAKDGTTLSMRGGGVIRIRPDGTGFEIVGRGQRNIYDVAVSPTLDLFTRDNTNDGDGWDVRLSFVPPGAHLGYPFLFKSFPEDMLQPLFDYGGGSPCGALWLDEPGLQNGLYTVEWGQSAIMYHDLKQAGAGWVVGESGGPEGVPPPEHSKGGQTAWLKLVRPTDMDVDASGALFITSWEGATFTYNGPNAGYVLRATKKGREGAALPDLNQASSGDLAKLLGSDSGVRRLAAQRELIRRGPPAADLTAELLKVIASDATPLAGRIAALYTWKLIGPPDVNAAIASLAVTQPDLREWVVRALGDDRSVAAQMEIPLPQSGAELAETNPERRATIGAVLVAALADPAARIRAAAIMTLRRLGKAEAGAAIVPLVADPDPVISHLAVRALSELKAAQPCLAALDSSEVAVHPGALRALYGIYEPAVVDGLIERLAKASQTSTLAAATSADGISAPDSLRHGILNALCRLANQDAPFNDSKAWWNIRPDTTGPIYEPTAWSETAKITAVLKQTLEAAPDDEARWLVARMYKTKVAYPGLVELMLAKAGGDTLAKLTAIEGMIRADNSLPPEGIAALQSIATSEQEPPEWRVRALQIFQRCAGNETVFPGALAAFAPLAGRDLQDAKIRGVFEDFTRGSANGKWVEDYRKALAADDVPKRLLAATVLVNLSTSKVGSDTERDAAKKAVEQGWAKPESAAALLTAIGRTGAKPLADQVKAHLNHPNNSVAESALFAYQQLGLKEGAVAKTIGELSYEDVFAAAQKGGDPKAGQELFLRAACIACHTINADEPVKGPVLSAVAKIYDRAALTESILKPNAKMAQGFESAWIKTKKGEQFDGFVTREAADSLDLRNVAGQTIYLQKADIAERGRREQSIMPEGLMNAFTPGELANLLAWIESLKQ